MKLGDIVEFKYGKGLPERSRVPGEFPVYGSGGCVGWHKQSLVEGPGIVVGRKGTVGATYWVDKDFFPIDTTFYVLPKSEKIRKRFIYYLLKSLPLPDMNTDAAVPGLNRDNALRLDVSVPSEDQQDQIVAYLSAYDQLIRNNANRIEVLEEAARLLYREWFVRLRFPGCEHVEVVNGVPSGWSQTTIGEHCPLVYGKALKSDTREPGEVDVYGSSGIVGVHNKALVTEPAIIVGRKGNVGSIFWARRQFWPIDTVYYAAPENSDFFTYYALQNVQFINTDVAVPGLNRDFAHSRKLIIPPEHLLEGFHAQIEPIQAQIGVLERQAAELAKARDLLLPRLMDGRLEV